MDMHHTKDTATSYARSIFMPEDYDAEQTYPLMIFLHGAGERGTDLEMLKVHGPPKLITEGRKFPCYVLAPLCPKDVWWDVEKLNSTLDQFLESHKVDTDRIYLTGLSMGGYGTWLWSCKYPERFAAIAPICGGGNPEDVAAIKDIPTWVFHGAEDEVVLISESQKMVDALEVIGHRPKFTIYPEADHDSWTETYNNEELYSWMFTQKK